MVFTYCTVSDVSNELNGLTIDASSIPSQSTVESWIEQESDSINDSTKKVWSSEVFDIYMDYNAETDIRVPLFPLLTITSLQYNKSSLGNTPDWVTLTEGDAEDFILYQKQGVISLIQTGIPAGRKRIRIQGTYGYSTTPNSILKATAKYVARRIISSILNEQSTEEGGSVSVGAIALSDPTTFSLDRMKTLDNEINMLLNDIGKFKSYRLYKR